MWFLDLCIYRMNLIDINPLHAGTLILIIVGAFLFSLGGVLAFLVPSKLIARHLIVVRAWGKTTPKPQYKWFKYLLILVLVLIVCAGIRGLFEAAAHGSGDGGLMMRARSAGVADATEGGVVKPLFIYLAEWLTFAAVLFQVERIDRAFRLTFALAFISCIGGGGRMGFLVLFTGLTSVYLIKTKRETIIPAYRFARWPFLAFLSLFIIMMFVIKDTSRVGSKVATFAEESLIQYVIGPTSAMDYVLQHPYEYTGMPNHTFKLFLSAASALGLTDYTPPATFDSFLFIPFATNVYTVYKYYITDFGISATLAIIVFIGFGHVLLYRKAHTSSELGLYMFAISVPTVITVIFDDGYVAFGVFLNALVFGMMYLALRSVPSGISLRKRGGKGPDASLLGHKKVALG
jgi:oligosaccharide repeat unit polymerase